MLTLRKIMAACALAHDKDCSQKGWEYDGSSEDWFDDVIGIVSVGREMRVYLMNKNKDGISAEVTIVTLSTEEVDAAADLVGYLDMF